MPLSPWLTHLVMNGSYANVRDDSRLLNVLARYLILHKGFMTSTMP